MRIFASERVSVLMQKLGMGEGEAIEHPWVTKAIENAQRKVESRNFDIRKQILEYDDVANDQRKVIYRQRDELMAAADISSIITAIRKDVVNKVITQYIPPRTMEEQWDIKGLEAHLKQEFIVDIPVEQMLEEDRTLHEETLRERIIEILEQSHQDKATSLPPQVLKRVEKSVMLQVLDNSWKEHLAAMDNLRQGIHLRGYAQKDPKQEYKREAFQMFAALLEHIKYEVIEILAKVQVRQEADAEAIDEQRQAPKELHYEHAEAGAEEQPATLDEEPPARPAQQQPFVHNRPKVGRNDPCPCGSGKKFKQCHGRLDVR
jgi:preprotein translocase subunit SecA